MIAFPGRWMIRPQPGFQTRLAGLARARIHARRIGRTRMRSKRADVTATAARKHACRTAEAGHITIIERIAARLERRDLTALAGRQVPARFCRAIENARDVADVGWRHLLNVRSAHWQRRGFLRASCHEQQHRQQSRRKSHECHRGSLELNSAASQDGTAQGDSAILIRTSFRYSPESAARVPPYRTVIYEKYPQRCDIGKHSVHSSFPSWIPPSCMTRLMSELKSDHSSLLPKPAGFLSLLIIRLSHSVHFNTDNFCKGMKRVS